MEKVRSNGIPYFKGNNGLFMCSNCHFKGSKMTVQNHTQRKDCMNK